MEVNLEDPSVPRKRLARLRCLRESIQCFQRNEPLPTALCYVPSQLQNIVTRKAQISFFSEPDKKYRKPQANTYASSSTILTSGERVCNDQGLWAKIIEGSVDKTEESADQSDSWILLHSTQSHPDEPALIVPVEKNKDLSVHERLFGKIPQVLDNWEEVIEHSYGLRMNSNVHVEPPHQEAVTKLRSMPPNWSIEYDEDLAQFLSDHTETDDDNLGIIKNYVESISVSSFCEDEDGPKNLTDDDPDTFWESDGSQASHWIRMKMKKGTIVKKLLVTVDGRDENYLPTNIVIYGGEIDSLKQLSETHIDQHLAGVADICVLQDQTEHFPIIEIRIKECKEEGIDTRIHLIKIKSSKERDLGLSKDLFRAKALVRYPKLESFDPEILYRRSIVLQRFVQLLDSVLPYIVPAWEYSIGTFTSLDVIRQLLLLSKKRLSLIDTFLRESETGRPTSMPRLYINRRAAAEHKSDPYFDPDCKNTVFNQIYEGLKPSELDYRWPSRYYQWWECKFLSEGIIDQGGGFRDSLCDMADELCPGDSAVPLPLPLFVRAPNQLQVDSNVNRDVYVPNPNCSQFSKYQWIGQLMGACLRGEESFVLSLPSFIWKQLSGEKVTWSRDFVTVDAAEVKMIENMENLDKESFDAYFSEERNWTVVLSDVSVIDLKPDGTEKYVTHDEVKEYCKLVKNHRMHESQRQVDAIKQGLLKVIPQAVLDLLTWQELEARICGNPEINIENLKRTTHYEDLEPTDTRVQYMWEALGNFSNEDRSRFLRFVTGRRRLPAPLYIGPDKGDIIDALPESSTCTNTLYLPSYSSAKICEEKLRYAAYNCIAIDTDVSPWDE